MSVKPAAQIMELNAEYQIAGETHTDTSKLIQKKEKKKAKKEKHRTTLL